MSGLINTGLAYEKQAISGKVRDAAESQKIAEANYEIELGEKEQRQAMYGSMIGLSLAMSDMFGRRPPSKDTNPDLITPD